MYTSEQCYEINDWVPGSLPVVDFSKSITGWKYNRMESHQWHIALIKRNVKESFQKLESWKKNRTDTMDVLFGNVKTKSKSKTEN